jgi:hypothetical protein
MNMHCTIRTKRRVAHGSDRCNALHLSVANYIGIKFKACLYRYRHIIPVECERYNTGIIGK